MEVYLNNVADAMLIAGYHTHLDGDECGGGDRDLCVCVSVRVQLCVCVCVMWLRACVAVRSVRENTREYNVCVYSNIVIAYGRVLPARANVDCLLTRARMIYG